jgi:hypothetical protein
MAGKGGKRSTTWKKGENPTRQPGQKSKSTLLKESLGLANWDKLTSYIENEGSEKLVDEMDKLSGKDFINAYSSLAEFVKPKLNRTTLVGDKDKPLTFTINYNNQAGNEPLNSE